MSTAWIRIRILVGMLALGLVSPAVAQDDITPPEVKSHALSPFISKDAANKTATRISLYFTEPVDEASAKDIAHYAFPGAVVAGAKVAVTTKVLLDPLNPDAGFTVAALKVVVEVTPAPASGAAYSLRVHDIQDLAGNVMVPKTLSGTTPFYEVDLALTGTATQSSTPVDADGVEYGTANLGADGDIDGFFSNGSVTINQGPEDNGWWEVDLGATKPIGRLQVWFRSLTADECQALFNACGVRNDDFKLLILDSNRNPIFTRQYPGRPPGTVAYNLPPGVNGRFVRFEMQNPRTSSDGYFSLAELAVVAPYEGAAIEVTQSPASTTVVENQTAKFGPVSANLTGAPNDRLQIQWEVNGVNIEGAVNPTYTTPPVALGDSGSHYRAIFLLPGLTHPTEMATLSVTPDQFAPTLKSVVSSAAYTFLTVTFSEGVRADTATALNNYACDGGVNILDATVVNPAVVRLTTSPQTPGKAYTLTVNNVRDLAAGAGNLIQPNSTKKFTTPESDQDRFVTIGNPGNPNDQDYGNGSGAQGSVAYVYQIGKYEVNNTEYAAFLNAKAKSDPNSLWDAGMLIAREGEDGDYTYTVNEGSEKKPVYMVAAVDAMRYVNWINNGGTESSDTETGTYAFSGYDVVGLRNPKAEYFLPTENEWYKAAYYDPTKGGTGGYWLYPVRTSDPALLNYQDSPGNAFTICFLSDSGGPPGPCDEDAFPLSSSYYGTFSQAGSLWEWNELLAGSVRPRRSGGSWGNNAARVAASVRADNALGNGGASVNQGFRLAKVSPLPSLTISRQGNFVKIEWSGVGVLVSSTSLDGPYKPEAGVTGSPALVPVNLSQTRYFRIMQ